MVGDDRAKPQRSAPVHRRGAWRPHSRDRPNSGRSRMPIAQPAERRRKPDPAVQRAGRDAADEGADVAAEADAARPSPSAGRRSRRRASDSAGGQAVRANGLRGGGRRHRAEDHAEVGQARRVAEDRIRRARASGPAIARIRRRRNRSRASAASFAPHTVKPKVTLQGWWPARNTPIESSADQRCAPMTIARRGLKFAPRAARDRNDRPARPAARLASVTASPPHGPK